MMILMSFLPVVEGLGKRCRVFDEGPVDQDRVIQRIPHRPILHVIDVQPDQGPSEEGLVITMHPNEFDNPDEILGILPSTLEGVPMRKPWHGFGIFVLSRE